MNVDVKNYVKVLRIMKVNVKETAQPFSYWREGLALYRENRAVFVAVAIGCAMGASQ